MAHTCSETELESEISGSASEHDFEMIQSQSNAPCAPASDRNANNHIDQEHIDRSIGTMKKLTKKRTDLWCLALQLTMKKLPPDARRETKMAITKVLDERYSSKEKPVGAKIKVDQSTTKKENAARNETSKMASKKNCEKHAKHRKTVNVAPIIWSGSISMIDVTTFSISLSSIHGDPTHLGFPFELDVIGRISPESVYTYIACVKLINEIVLLRFSPVSEGDENAYRAFVKYLHSRHRFGVIHTRCKMIKDFYVLPLPAGQLLPPTLMPANAVVDLGADRTDLLLGVIVKRKAKSSKMTKCEK